MTRFSRWASNSPASTLPTSFSDGVRPSSSALVESESSSRMPWPSPRAPIRARSVRRPSTGVRSSLKSPVCKMTPWGVWKARAKPCGTEWATGMNSMSNGPILPCFPVLHHHQLRAVEQARLLDAVAGQADGQLGTVDRHAHVAQEVGQPAAMVLVAVGDHAALEPVLVLDYVGEVGQDEVDAGHLRLGEHEPAVDQHGPAVHLEPGAVAPDLAQAAEEGDAHRGRPPAASRCPGATRRGHPATGSGERPQVQVAPDLLGLLVQAGRRRPHGQAAFAGGEPERPQHRLGGHGVGGGVAGLELPGLAAAGR